jgi:hypothetical protein
MVKLALSRQTALHHLYELNENEIQLRKFEVEANQNSNAPAQRQFLTFIVYKQDTKFAKLEPECKKAEYSKLFGILTHWKLLVAHHNKIRQNVIFSWVKVRRIKRYVLYIWKQVIRQSRDRAAVAFKKWQKYIILKKRARIKKQKKQTQLEKKKQEHELHELSVRLQIIHQKYLARACIIRWKKYTKKQCHRRLIVQIVKQQWLENTVYPARLSNLQLERVLIQFLTKAISACIIHFSIVLNVPFYTKATNEFIRILSDITRCEPTMPFALKSCKNVLQSSFTKLTLKFLREKPCLKKYNSVKKFFDDLNASVHRFSTGLQKLSVYVPENQQGVITKQILSAKYEISIFHMLRWQRNNNAPTYIIFFPEEEAIAAILAWLSESSKRLNTVSVIALLDSFMPKFMEGPNNETVELFTGDLYFFSRKPVRIKFVPRSQ